MPTRTDYRILAVSLALVIAADTANGGNGMIYKCVGTDGTPAYQSEPCIASMTQAWVRPSADYASSSPAAAEARPPPAHRPTDTRAPARRGSDRIVRSERRMRCAAEKRKVAAERAERWMHIGIDDLRRMDARIARACD